MPRIRPTLAQPILGMCWATRSHMNKQEIWIHRVLFLQPLGKFPHSPYYVLKDSTISVAFAHKRLDLKQGRVVAY